MDKERGVRVRLHFDEGLVEKEFEKAWFVFSKSTAIISDLSYFIIEKFQLQKKCNEGVILKLDGFSLYPNLCTDVIHEGELLTVHRKLSDSKKRKRSLSNETSSKKERKTSKKNVILDKEGKDDKALNKKKHSHKKKKRKKDKKLSKNNEKSSEVEGGIPLILRQTTESLSIPSVEEKNVNESSVPVELNNKSQTHIEFNEDDNQQPKLIRTAVYLRPPKRPTVESWQNSGWRKNYDYNLPKTKKRNRRRRRNSEPKSDNMSTTDTQQNTTKNYSSYSPFVGIPMVGDILAYKILEVSARMRPEMSEWKESKVIEFDQESQTITLEQLNLPLQIKEEGEDDEDIQEIDPISIVQWNEIQDARLILKSGLYFENS